MNKTVILTDWAIVNWENDQKIIGMNQENHFVKTSPIAIKINDNCYQTKSGTIYILLGAPNQEWNKVQQSS